MPDGGYTRADWNRELKASARRMRSGLKHDGDIHRLSRALAECVEEYLFWEMQNGGEED